jgi:hypothetical protein
MSPTGAEEATDDAATTDAGGAAETVEARGEEGSAGASPGRPATLVDDLLPRLGQWGRRIPVARLLQLLAIVPALVMVDVVRNSSDLQALDYWTVFPQVVSPTGSLEVSNLLHFHEGHVLGIPGVLYWANWKLFDGVNRTLGVYVIGVVVAQVLLLRAMLPKASRLGQWAYSGLVVAFSVLVFTPQGAHHFGRAMSGTAWLTANLLSLCAIFLAHRRRPLAAIPFAVAATVCYGTGLMAWPAILVVTALRSRWAWRQWVLLGSAVAVVGTYAALYERPQSQASTSMQPNEVLHRTAQVLGTVVSADPDIAVLAGVVGVVLAAALTVTAVRTRTDGIAPWVGLAVYAGGGALLIGGARGGINGDTVGVSSRYASSSALLWAAVIVLIVVVVGTRAWVAVGGLVLAGVCYVGGQQALADVREFAVDQDGMAVAIRMDVARGSIYFPFAGEPWLLDELDHYPFSPGFDIDCGLLDTSVDDLRVVPMTPEMKGSLDVNPPSNGRFLPPTVELSGWVVTPGADPRCIVFADESGTVVGAAGYGIERPELLRQVGAPGGDFNRGFRGPARGPAESYRAYVMLEDDDGVLYELPGEVAGELAPPADATAEADSP